MKWVIPNWQVNVRIGEGKGLRLPPTHATRTILRYWDSLPTWLRKKIALYWAKETKEQL